MSRVQSKRVSQHCLRLILSRSSSGGPLTSRSSLQPGDFAVLSRPGSRRWRCKWISKSPQSFPHSRPATSRCGALLKNVRGESRRVDREGVQVWTFPRGFFFLGSRVPALWHLMMNRYGFGRVRTLWRDMRRVPFQTATA